MGNGPRKVHFLAGLALLLGSTGQQAELPAPKSSDTGPVVPEKKAASVPVPVKSSDTLTYSASPSKVAPQDEFVVTTAGLDEEQREIMNELSQIAAEKNALMETVADEVERDFYSEDWDKLQEELSERFSGEVDAKVTSMSGWVFPDGHSTHSIKVELILKPQDAGEATILKSISVGPFDEHATLEMAIRSVSRELNLLCNSLLDSEK